MFSKLLKHEWKANAGLLWILSACAVGVGLLGAGILRTITYLEAHMLNGQMAAIAISSLSSMMVFVVLALVAYALAVQFINLWRFYKNKFTDEGYLTFTLPVNPHQIFLASLLNILAWLVISACVVLLSVLLMVFVGTSEQVKEFFRAMVEMDQAMGDVDEIGLPGIGLFMCLSLVQIFVAPVYAIVLLMTSITLGCVLAKKHKILATIGMYYVINMVVNVISSVLSVVPTIMMLGSMMENMENYMYNLSLAVGLSLLMQIGLSIGGYFWSTHLMKHKLNLP